jgi:hypothetical protein
MVSLILAARPERKFVTYISPTVSILPLHHETAAIRPVERI